MTAATGIAPGVVLVVLAAGALHASWNAITKHLDDRLMAFAMIGLAATAAGGLTLLLTGWPARAAIPFALCSAVLHVWYEIGLMNAYRLGAFNQSYPIARGTSPLLVAAGAYLLAGERPGAAQLAGIAVLAAGLISLAASAGRLTRDEAPAVAAALITGVAIAAYSLLDGLGVRHAHDPYAYAGLLFLAQGPALPLAALARRPRSAWLDGSAMTRAFAAGLLSLAAYGAVLWAQTRAPLAAVAALRETSVISAALIGMLCFRERLGRRRMIAAVVVAAGILLIAA